MILINSLNLKMSPPPIPCCLIHLRTCLQAMHCDSLSTTGPSDNTTLLQLANRYSALVCNLTVIFQNCFHRCEGAFVLAHKHTPEALHSSDASQCLYHRKSNRAHGVYKENTSTLIILNAFPP